MAFDLSLDANAKNRRRRKKKSHYFHYFFSLYCRIDWILPTVLGVLCMEYGISSLIQMFCSTTLTFSLIFICVPMYFFYLSLALFDCSVKISILCRRLYNISALNLSPNSHRNGNINSQRAFIIIFSKHHKLLRSVEGKYFLKIARKFAFHQLFWTNKFPERHSIGERWPLVGCCCFFIILFNSDWMMSCCVWPGHANELT